MIRQITLIGVLAFLTIAGSAQTKKQQDVKAIKSICGCYEVGFNFSETFSYSKDSRYKPSPTKRTGALGWVVLAEEDDSRFALQHILIAGKKGRLYSETLAPRLAL